MKMSFWNKSQIRIYLFLVFAFILTVYSLFPENKKEIKLITKEIDFKTEYVYKDNIPSNVTKVITEGVNGVANIETETNKQEVIKEPINEVVEVGTAAVGQYVGTLTGYGPDCKGCSKVGNVACYTENKQNHSLINDGIIYNDDEYGEIRILAADLSLFPCGTIIEFSNDGTTPTIGVVLDTGSAMRVAWQKYNKVAIDLAFGSEKGTSDTTNKNTTFNVKRWGW